MALFGKTLSAAGALLVAAGALGAQATDKAQCDVGTSMKGNLAKASLAVDAARQQSGNPAASTSLKSAVKAVESPDKNDDPTARALLLGQSLSLWLSQPGVGLRPHRADLGFTTNPDATIDLIGSVDSLFRVVETAKPACSDITSYYRGGLKFYLEIANASINALNADKLDSAEFYATQANRLYPASPYGTMVLGNVASRRGDLPKAIGYWSASAAAAAHDSAYRDVQRQMLNNIGVTYLNQANAATGAARVDAARKAAEAYTKLLAIPATKGAYAYGSRQNLQSALLLAGDTAAFVASYQGLIAHPSEYDYQDLLNSAVNAARSSKNADAVKLFEGTLAQNPYNRDALFNLAVTLLALEQNDKVGPVATRLVAVDPSNPENYNLGARAYLALAKAAQTAKKTALAAAYNDTTLTWYNKGNRLPAEVTFTEFTPSDKQLTISGTVLDRRDKIDTQEQTRPAKKGAKPAPKPSAAPKAMTLKFEALDKSGAVVGTQSVTTEALTPGKTAKFTVQIPATNAIAYRYTVVD